MSLSSEELYEHIEKEFDLPIKDKTLNGLFMMQFNFDDLRTVLEFLLSNQKKQQFLISQLIEQSKASGGTQIIERIIEKTIPSEKL